MTQIKLLVKVFLLFSIVSCSPDSFSESRDPLIVRGRINAIQKAHLLTDIHFIPLNTFQGNGILYQKDVEYSGMIYSSVKEIGTYVGNNVGLYTFLTAVNNPRSVLYTTDLSKEPYNGKNCHAYYGTVCSSFVSYALGIVPGLGSYDFPVSELFDKVNYTSPEDIEVADVLWFPGHVALVTGTGNKKGYVSSVEVSQAVGEGCVRRVYDREGFEDLMNGGFQSVFRYRYLYNNTDPDIDYTTLLKDVDDFSKNAICVNKGDKYCYLEGETVVLNVFKDYKSIIVSRDGDIITKFSNGESGDLVLDDLLFGDYRASITLDDGTIGGETEWIVVNYSVSFDPSNNTVYFNSTNAIPESARLTNKAGGRGGLPLTEVFSRLLTEEEVSRSSVTIPANLLNDECPYYSITYKTKFGRISLPPQLWKE